MNILDEIKAAKVRRLEAAKIKVPLREIKKKALDVEDTRDFNGSIGLRREGLINLIAEIKKASPSKGLISRDFDHKAIAVLYENAPVSALSVLTEEDFFQGSVEIFTEVKRIVSKPLLRKDFIFDEYQIYESRAMGADALLLIAALLGRNQSSEYLHLCRELSMAVLYEVHNEDELEQALWIEAPTIGINNRDLKTLKIDVSVSERLVKSIPNTILKVSESGIGTRQDADRMKQAGFDAILVGTSIVGAADRESKIKELMGYKE